MLLTLSGAAFLQGQETQDRKGEVKLVADDVGSSLEAPDTLSIAFPIRNDGATAATAVRATAIAVEGGKMSSPKEMPIELGTDRRRRSRHRPGQLHRKGISFRRYLHGQGGRYLDPKMARSASSRLSTSFGFLRPGAGRRPPRRVRQSPTRWKAANIRRSRLTSPATPTKATPGEYLLARKILPRLLRRDRH